MVTETWDFDTHFFPSEGSGLLNLQWLLIQSEDYQWKLELWKTWLNHHELDSVSAHVPVFFFFYVVATKYHRFSDLKS